MTTRRKPRTAAESISHAFGCSRCGLTVTQEGNGWLIRCRGCGRAAWTTEEPDL